MWTKEQGKGAIASIVVIVVAGMLAVVSAQVKQRFSHGTSPSTEQGANNSFPSDDEIKKMMIKEEAEAYFNRMQARGNAGTCPCPYSINRAGNRCGDSSAYVKPRGESPWCYPKNISKAELESWKSANRERLKR
jgi:hypothetical protein